MKQWKHFCIVAICIMGIVAALPGATARADEGIKKAPRAIEHGTYPGVVYGPLLDNTLSALNESFEGVTFPPAGWIKLSPDGGPGWNRQTVGTTPLPGWNGGVITAPAGGGTAVAYATWTTGGTTRNDQWLVTPQLTNVQEGDSLLFSLRYWPNSYSDTIEVRISTGTPTVGNFTIFVATLTFETPGGDTTWHQYGYRLGDFVPAGSNIHVAFRERVVDNFNDGASFSLDLVKVNVLTGVSSQVSTVPSGLDLQQNYPNPFNPSTNIRFSLPVRDYVTLKVFNQLGQEIATLQDGQLEAGTFTVDWNATGLASGIYYYRLQSGNLTTTKKLLLVQ